MITLTTKKIFNDTKGIISNQKESNKLNQKNTVTQVTVAYFLIYGEILYNLYKVYIIICKLIRKKPTAQKKDGQKRVLIEESARGSYIYEKMLNLTPY